MVLHPTEPLWVPDTMRLNKWWIGLDFLEGALPHVLGGYAPMQRPGPNLNKDWFTHELPGRSWHDYAREYSGQFVDVPADTFGRKRTFPKPKRDMEDPANIKRIVMLVDDNACGSCPLSLRCMQRKPLAIEVIYGPATRKTQKGTFSTPKGTSMVQPMKDFCVYRCYRCHCIAFGISTWSETMEFDGTMYVCPHLRHGRWERDGKLNHGGPTGPFDYVSLALHLDVSGHQIPSIPNGCHTECDHENLKGYNPDHSLNRTNKIRSLWPGYGEHQLWNDIDCVHVLAHQSDIPVEFR